MVGSDDDGRAIVDAKLLELANVLGNDAKGTGTLPDLVLIDLLELLGLAIFVQCVGPVGTLQVDDAVGAPFGFVASLEDGVLKGRMHPRVVDEVGRAGRVARVRGTHGGVDRVRRKPEEGLEDGGEVAIEANAEERLCAAQDVDVARAGLDGVDVHRLVLEGLEPVPNRI